MDAGFAAGARGRRRSVSLVVRRPRVSMSSRLEPLRFLRLCESPTQTVRSPVFAQRLAPRMRPVWCPVRHRLSQSRRARRGIPRRRPGPGWTRLAFGGSERFCYDGHAASLSGSSAGCFLCALRGLCASQTSSVLDGIRAERDLGTVLLPMDWGVSRAEGAECAEEDIEPVNAVAQLVSVCPSSQ